MTVERPLVLCVEDDWQTCQIILKVLSLLPVDSQTANQGDHAVELARQHQPHLIILDLMLPGLGGWEALEAIRRGPHRADLRVLVLTARDNRAERLLAANIAQVDQFMTKPFDIADLARGVIRLLDLPAEAMWPLPPA